MATVNTNSRLARCYHGKMHCRSIDTFDTYIIENLINSLNRLIIEKCLKKCSSWNGGTAIKVSNFPPPLKYINRYLIKHDRKASPWNKISILTEKNKRLTLYIIPNRQNKNWCKTEKFTCFYKVQHVIKRMQHLSVVSSLFNSAYSIATNKNDLHKESATIKQVLKENGY